MNFARLFKGLRTAMNISQARFATALRNRGASVSQPALSKIESGLIDPPVRVFIAAYRPAATLEHDGVHKEWDAALHSWSLKERK